MVDFLSRGCRTPGTCVALVALALAPAAEAAWEAVPEVSLTARSDDNLLLAPNNAQSASEMLLDAGVEFVNFTERGNMYVEPRVIANSYSDNEAAIYETEDFFLNAGGQYNWQTLSAGFRTRYADQLILNSEFSALLPEDPNIEPGDEFIDPDTGRLVFSRERRETIDLRGNFDYRTSQRDAFRLELRRQDVSYSTTGTPAWSDYDNNALAFAYIRQLAPRSTASVSITASEFSATRNNNTSDSIGIQARYARPLSQTWTVNLNAGYQRVDYAFQGSGTSRVQNDSSSPTVGIDLRKRAERSLWNFGYTSTVQPNGSGFLVQRNELRAFATYEFSQRLTGGFAVRYANTETLDDVRLSDERKYLRSGFELEWALRPTIFLTFGIDQLTQEFVNEADSKATSNGISFGIRYRGRSRQEAL